MIFRTFVSGLAVAAAMSGAAQAATTTYIIDQAFWGAYSINTLQTAVEWQADRQAAVAANPSAHSFLTGSVSVDWDTYSLVNFALSVDIEIDGIGAEATFAQSDPATGIGGVVVQHSAPTNTDSVSLNNLTTNWNGSNPPASSTYSQYMASLDFTLIHDRDDDDIRLSIGGANWLEYYIFENCVYGECFPIQGYETIGSHPYTRTYGGTGATVATSDVSTVPLPGAAALLAGGLGLLGSLGLWRKRRATIPGRIAVA